MKKIQIKRFKKCTKTALLIAAALVLSAVPVSPFPASATSIEDAEQQKQEASENKEDAEEVLNNLKDTLATVESELSALDAEVSDIQAKITANEEEEEALNDEIEVTTANLADAQVEEDNQYASMMKRIQYLYENGDVEYIDTLMSSASFTDMLNQSEYIEQLSSYDQEQLNSLIAVREEIEVYEAMLEADLRKVEAVQEELTAQKAVLENKVEEKEALKEQYESDINVQTALVEKYEAEIEEIDAEIARLQEEAQASSSVTYYDTSSSGAFAWPVPGYSSISSGFGPRKSPTAGASTNHKGIDIPCPTGTSIIASASGTVTIAKYSSSAGYYIMINHGGGVSTVYMHNSQLLVSVGQTVSQGQVIAKAGSTGYSTGSHCHFGIMINGSYVNPLNYL